MSGASVTFSRNEHVGIISFNRPETLNAWAWGPTNDLCSIADDLRFDPGVRVVVLRGEGRAFCAGEDLNPDTRGPVHGDVAATDAVFALPQVTLVTQIVGGADLRMVSELGAARTKWLAMTGRRFGADDAERWGLVQLVVEPEELLGTTMTLAHEIAANAPLAVQGVKRVVNQVAYAGFDEAARFEAMSSSVLWSSDDLRAGFAAKARKGQAQFQGK